MFKLTTTNHGSGVVSVKPFAWSYSALKSFESCPKRHWHTNIQKDVKDGDTTALDKGNEVHDAIAKYLVKRVPMKVTGHVPAGLVAIMKEWADKVLSVDAGSLHVEQKMGLTREFKPTTFFGKDVWYRGISDVTRIVGPVAAAIDWKTGKPKDDASQLVLMAACIMAHNPEVMKVRTEFVWLEHNTSSRVDVSRSDLPLLWSDMLPRVAKLEHAIKNAEFPPKPSGLCRKWCPVQQCAHWIP